MYMEINWLNASESRDMAYANQLTQPFLLVNADLLVMQDDSLLLN